MCSALCTADKVVPCVTAQSLLFTFLLLSVLNVTALRDVSGTLTPLPNQMWFPEATLSTFVLLPLKHLTFKAKRESCKQRVHRVIFFLHRKSLSTFIHVLPENCMEWLMNNS